MKKLFCLINIAFFATFAFSQSMSHETYEYAESLATQADNKFMLGDCKEALRLGTEALAILEKTRGKEHPSYAVLLTNLAEYNNRQQNYSEAIRLQKEALPICEKILRMDSKILRKRLSRNRPMTLKEHLRKQPKLLGEYLGNQALAYSRLGKYAEAILLKSEALEIYEKGSSWNEVYAYYEGLSTLAKYYYNLGNYHEAIRLMRKKLDFCEQKWPRKNWDDWEWLALFNSAIGNYSEAIYLESEVCAFKKKSEAWGEGNPFYWSSLEMLAEFYAYSGDYVNSIRVMKEVLNLMEKKGLGKDFSYALSLAIISYIYYLSGDYSEATHLGEEVFNILQKEVLKGDEWDVIIIKSDPKYRHLLQTLAKCNSRLGNYSETIRLQTEALPLWEKEFRKEHHPNDTFGYIDALADLVFYHLKLGDYQEATSYMLKLKDVTSIIIFDVFANTPEYERTLFWTKYQGLCQKEIPRWSYKFPSAFLIEFGFDATLLSKGILLSVSKNMSEFIMESSDPKLVSLYATFRQNRMMIQQQYEKPIAERIINTDSLETVIFKQEQELIHNSKKYGDYVNDLKVQWRDVQKSLRSGDIAVEFVSFPLGSDSTIYIAYVLDKEMKFPEMVPLFEEKQLKGLKDIYIQKQASELVWEPLSKYFADKKNVYFAPDGELYNIAIESLPHWSEDCLMSDKWNMYRLSSTRELAVIKDKNALKQASVYGGVKYDTSTDMLVTDHRKFHTNERSVEFLPFVLSDSLNLRSGVAYLPATRMEAEEIDKTLENKKIATSLRIDTLATEGDFKSLSGKGTDLLHVATHGFYWTEREAQYREDLRFLMLSHDKNPRYVEDKALTRSGLLLAGANNALMGKQLPEGVDDGILTAKEISQLDLRGMDLVVLSACQTGLGEIKGDGVFGLQRGFKKAGVNSILMSLWKVDDEATRILMTQFYKNLTSGMSKFESLKQAQKSVREKNPKYQDPYYWAAFILLDAIH